MEKVKAVPRERTFCCDQSVHLKSSAIVRFDVGIVLKGVEFDLGQDVLRREDSANMGKHSSTHETAVSRSTKVDLESANLRRHFRHQIQSHVRLCAELHDHD